MLFCDLVGFTAFSELRDPEEVRDVLDQYFASARRIVSDFAGTIEKFIGDAIMALWGAPLSREDDAERAVRAGLEITRAVASLAERLDIPDLRVRAGVATGEAAVDVGADGQGMVTGDIVNTAARIQSVAEANSALVDDTTRLAVERRVAFAPAGEHFLKGKTTPVRVWRALTVLDRAPRTPAVEPPLVGRDGPLSEITSSLEALVASPDPGVCVVRVTGEPGIGKSRLGIELQRRAELNSAIRWHRGRSLAFGEGTGLSALAEIVRGVAGSGRAEPTERQRALVEQLVSERFGKEPEDGKRIERAVLRLLDLDDRREVIERGELFSAWRTLFERLAADGPVVLVFEEAQLADPALFAFIAHMSEWSRGCPS